MAKHKLLGDEFWLGEESFAFLNPRLPEEERSHLERAIAAFPFRSSIWIKSSGTESSKSGQHKLVCLKKKAFLAAAQSVNQFYDINSSDCWLNPLPLFHVGGLSIFARCYLAGARVVETQGWDVEHFCQQLVDDHVTCVSLVPTQVYDLVQAEKKAPEQIKLAVIGGGALSKSLYEKARKLGWPLSLSYGMTETCAMLAAQEMNSKEFPESLKILGHMKITTEDHKTFFESESLFDGYLFVGDETAEWERRDLRFAVDDRLVIDGSKLKILGRKNDLVKILGETVDVKALENKLEEYFVEGMSIAIVAYPHERKGYSLKAYIEGNKQSFSLDEFNEKLLPFERLEAFEFIDKFPRTDLGKIIKSELENRPL